MRVTLGIFFSLVFLFTSVSSAAPNYFNFNGYLTDSGGAAVVNTAGSFDVSIQDQVGCVVYRESHSVTTDGMGDFALKIGAGTTPTYFGSNSKFSQIFNTKNSAIAGDGCNVNGTTASWHLSLKYNGTAMGTVAITAVPFASVAEQSENADTLDGIDSSGFVQATHSLWSQLVGGTYTAPNATTATNVSGVVALANGGTGASTAAAARTNLGLGSLSTLSTSGSATDVLRGDGTWSAIPAAPVTSVAGKTGVVTLQATDITDFNTSADARITLQKGANSGLATLDSSGKVPSSQLALTASDIPNLDANKITTGTITNNVSSAVVSATTGQFTNLKIYDGTANYVTQVAPVGGFGGSGYTVQWPANVGASNQVLGISSIAGSVATLSWISTAVGTVTNVTASAPLASSGGANPNITITQANGSTSGYLSFSDWTAFNSKQAAGNYMTALTGDVTAAGPGSVSATIAAGAITSGKIANGAVTTTKALSTNPGINRLIASDNTTGESLSKIECSTVGQVLSWTVANGWQCNAISSLYTAPVTSVAGRTGVVTIASGDVTDATESNTVSTIVRRDSAGGFSAGAINVSGQVQASQYKTGSGTQTAPVVTAAGDASSGLFFPTTGNIGLSTTGVERMRIDSGGQVGIGTNLPAAKLDVNGDIKIANGTWQGAASARTSANGGPNKQIITRSFVTTNSTVGTVIFETADWQLQRGSTYSQFVLVSLTSANLSYWFKSGTTFTTGVSTIASSTFTLESGTNNEVQIFFGNPYSAGDFAHIVLQRHPSDYFWVGYIITTVPN